MSLTGRTVRIIISNSGETTENLFGTILSDWGGKNLLIRLSKPVRKGNVSSDLIQLSSWHSGDSVKVLLQNYSLTMTGTLVDKDHNSLNVLIEGSVTID